MTGKELLKPVNMKAVCLGDCRDTGNRSAVQESGILSEERLVSVDMNELVKSAKMLDY